MPAFSLDSLDDVAWTCVSFDKPWNGWVTPVVDRETLLDVVDTIGWTAEVVGSGLRVHDEDDKPGSDSLLEPDQEGLFHLYELGWTFVEHQEPTDAQVIRLPGSE